MRTPTLIAAMLVAIGALGLAWLGLRGWGNAEMQTLEEQAAQSMRKTFDPPPGWDARAYSQTLTHSLGMMTYSKEHPDRIVPCKAYPADDLETVHRISVEQLGQTDIRESMLRMMMCQHIIGRNEAAETTGRRIIAELDAGEDDVELRRTVLSILYGEPFRAKARLWAYERLHTSQLGPSFNSNDPLVLDKRFYDRMVQRLNYDIQTEEAALENE